MPSVHRELHHDKVVLRYDAMNNSCRTIEVVTKRLHCLSEAVTALRTGGVLDEVTGYEIQSGFVSPAGALMEGENNLGGSHHVITMTLASEPRAGKPHRARAPTQRSVD
jgi:hypothetical protein